MADGKPPTLDPLALDDVTADDYLQQARQRGDPLADGTIRRIADECGGISRVRQMLNDLALSADVAEVAQADQDAGGAVWPLLNDYLTQSGRLPDWADERKIHQAQKFFEEHGFIAFLLLGASCLPELYTCGNGGTQVLDVTHALVEGAKRRIHQTAHIITSTMTPGDLKDASSPGVRVVQKVRLMHACVRFLALAPPPEALPPEALPPDPAPPALEASPQAYQQLCWDTSHWGIPIGQEYMAGTLQTFSYVILRGMRDLGITKRGVAEDPRSDSESVCYIHAWNVIGFILGVEEPFLRAVTTFADSERLFNRVMERNVSKTSDQKQAGTGLTTALLLYMQSLMKMNGFGILGLIPRLRLPQRVPKFLIQKMIGPQRASLLLTFDKGDIWLYPFWNAFVTGAMHSFLKSPFRNQVRACLGMIIYEQMCMMDPHGCPHDPGGCPHKFTPPKRLAFLWNPQENSRK